jgi:septum formation protein
LLRLVVPDFDVVVSGADERLPGGPLVDAVASVAETKGRAVAATVGAAVVVAADTLVVVDGDALGKPADRGEAIAMLRRLRGRPHEVMTGVVVIGAATGRLARGAEVTRVFMARYSDEAIERYVAGGSPFDKAGGYAIQDLGGALVEGLAGSYSNVIGLPVALTARLLAAVRGAGSGRGTAAAAGP